MSVDDDLNDLDRKEADEQRRREDRAFGRRRRNRVVALALSAWIPVVGGLSLYCSGRNAAWEWLFIAVWLTIITLIVCFTITPEGWAGE